MMKFRFRLLSFLVMLLLCACFSPVRADSPTRKGAEFASGAGNILYLAAGIGLPLLTDGAQGRNHALRALDATGTSVLLTEGLKALVREKRPDTNEHNSFPSGHATAAFAVATMQSAYHPKQAPLWYLGATLISLSRVRLHRHTNADIIAGAAVGYGISRLELSAPRGLILAPIISPDGQGMGLQVSKGL